MRGFETLLAASVATAGITQIAVMVARTPHVAPLSVDPPVSTCCQYRTWPVEDSLWTFPFSSQFHATESPTLENRPAYEPFAVPATPGSGPPPDLLYSPTGRGSGPLVARDYPWIDLVAGADNTDPNAVSEAAQNGSGPIWIGEGSPASSNAHSPVAPQMSLLLVDPGPGDSTVQIPAPSFVDTSPPSQMTPDVPPPTPQDLSDDAPPTQIAGNPGGPDNGSPGGTPPADVPEPTTLIVMLTSLLGLAALRHSQRV